MEQFQDLTHAHSFDEALLDDLCSTLGSILSASNRLKAASAKNAQLMKDFESNTSRIFGELVGVKHERVRRKLERSAARIPVDQHAVPASNKWAEVLRRPSMQNFDDADDLSLAESGKARSLPVGLWLKSLRPPNMTLG